MKLLDRLGGAAPRPAASPSPSPVRLVSLGRERPTFRAPVSWSQDLGRIMGLPRRTLDPRTRPPEADELERQLRISGPCRCAEFGKACPTHLLPAQAHALAEAAKVGGLVGAIGVGHGKTLIDLLLPMVMPGVKVAVLLIPANLRAQLLERDWHYYGGHWRLPNLAGGRWFQPGRPTLHVLTYNKLSNPESSDLLTRIKPDLIVCDEAHNLKDPKSARTIRFLRYLRTAPDTKLAVQSGTLTARSVKDYAHLAEYALGDGSPLPIHPPTLDEWAAALDPSDSPASPGALERLCDPGESIQSAFGRRRNDTPGVVATDEASVKNSLIIRRRDPGPVPPELLQYIDQARGGTRPDGEEFVEQLQIAECVWQLCCGFYHFWRYPRGEPPELIEKWFQRRQEFNRELREKLKRPREHLDSPGLLVKAAIRAYQDPPYDGDKPVWKASTWPDWSEVHRAVRPVVATKWLSDFVVQDAARWASDKKRPGIVWVEYPELGERIAKAAGVPFYGGGKEASAQIPLENGRRSIVASIAAHGTGKNLQAFCRNLVVTPPASGAVWEQLLGRTHRQGQLADEVEVEVYQHTLDFQEAFRKARDLAAFIQATEKTPQKLVYASYEDGL